MKIPGHAICSTLVMASAVSVKSLFVVAPVHVRAATVVMTWFLLYSTCQVEKINGVMGI